VAARYDALAMPLAAAAARRREGELRGGPAGAAQVEASDRALRDRGVAEPARLADVLVPVVVRPKAGALGPT
jgi:hypothetical protein